MKEKFFNKKVDSFYDYIFSRDFFPEVFGSDYRRKYSLCGEGIFNLVFLNDKIYSITVKEAKTMVTADGKKALRDPNKDILMEKICKVLDDNAIEYTMNSGKILTFKLGKYIAKLEVVQKKKLPDNLGKTLINGEWID